METRDDLVRLVTYRHREMLRNRRIEILVPWADGQGDQPQRRPGGPRDRDDRDGDDRTAGKWRDDRSPRDRDQKDMRRSGYAGTRTGEDRDFERGWRNPDWHDLPRKESGEQDRDRDRFGSSGPGEMGRRPGAGSKFTKFQNSDSNAEQVSDWRASMKGPLSGSSASAEEPRARDQRDRREERSDWRSDRSGGADDRKDRDSSPPNAWRKGAPAPDDRSAAAPTSSQPAERKKLQLAPRSVNATAAQAAELSERSAALFGGAKPVDTRTKEAEIENRMEQKVRRESESSTGAAAGKERGSRRESESSAGAGKERSRGEVKQRSSRSPTPQEGSRTPSPDARRRSPRTSRSPSPEESERQQRSPRTEANRTPSPTRSPVKSPAGSSSGERAPPLMSPGASDRLPSGAESVRRDRDEETGEPGLDHRRRRRSSQAEEDDDRGRQRPAARRDRSPKQRYPERERGRDDDSERRYPDRNRYDGEFSLLFLYTLTPRILRPAL